MRLYELDNKAVQEIRAKWMETVSKAGAHRDVFEAEYTQLFERIAVGGLGSLKECLNKEWFAAIRDDGGRCWALTEMVHTQRGTARWVKLMDIYLAPEIEMAPDTADNAQKRLEAFTSALTGVFELTKGIKGVDAVKVYGRTETLLTFLRGMHGALSGIMSMGTITGIDVSIEGRWLVFNAA